jgi:hypothetical protein
LVPAVLFSRKAHQRECIATEVLSKNNHSVFPLTLRRKLLLSL